ncbi:hypothetical protein THAOC_08968, partial [Thalassiosira oceanica]
QRPKKGPPSPPLPTTPEEEAFLNLFWGMMPPLPDPTPTEQRSASAIKELFLACRDGEADTVERRSTAIRIFVSREDTSALPGLALP